MKKSPKQITLTVYKKRKHICVESEEYNVYTEGVSIQDAFKTFGQVLDDAIDSFCSTPDSGFTRDGLELKRKYENFRL